MKRRQFIQTTAAAATLPLVIGRMLAQAHVTSPALAAATGAATPTDRVLVLVYLQGGNDGLNTILPRDQYGDLVKVRPKIVVPETSILALTDKNGLHPALAGVQSLYKDGQIGIVQGVHSPLPDGSHFQATNILFSGLDSNQEFRTGWLGRYLTGEYPNFPAAYPSATVPDPLAITLGGLASSVLQGEIANTSIAVRNPADLQTLTVGPTGALPATPMGYEMGYLRQVVASLNAYSSTLKNATTKAKSLSTKYPTEYNHLAEQLKIVAQLVAGGLQTRVYVCNYGGFDTHNEQVDGGNSTGGHHAWLLRQVSEALVGFQDDLRLLSIQDRVVGMTVSEFGRRVSSTGLGTDHGEAAPVILFGTNINPTIHGTNPAVAGADKENVRMQYDFRTLYTSILQDWFKVPAATLSTLFPSQNTAAGFPYLPVIKAGTPPPVVTVGAGDGLTGAYYNGMNFETLQFTRVDPTINFNWAASPGTGINADSFSVRWTGQLLPRYGEEYTFFITSDNGRRLWVNGQLVIDGWVDDWAKEYSGKITLAAGQKVDLKLEYFEGVGGASAKLEWTSASQARQVVPQSQLFSAAAVPVPAPAAFNGIYQLVARHSGKALTISGASAADGGGAVQQTPAAGTLSQQWQVTAVGGGYYKLLARHSGKALDVSASSQADGAKVQQWVDNGGLAQRWKIEPTTDGYHKLTAECSGKVLDVSNASGADGAGVHQWGYGGSNNQQWKLVAAVAVAASGQAVTTAAVSAVTAAEAGPLQVYPNPSQGQATLAFSAATDQRVTVYVHDQQGRLVTLLTVPAQAGRTDFRLPVTLRPGIYHLRARIDGQPQQFTLQIE